MWLCVKRQLETSFLLVVVTLAMFSLLAGLFVSPTKATYVEGHIAQDTTWTLVDSPYVVSKDIIVDPTVTLTIEPGVEVAFGGKFTLYVQGILYAVGMADRPITFTSNSQTPQRGDWQSVLFQNTSSWSTLDHTSIKYATDGITSERGKLTLKNSEITLSNDNGIRILDSEVVVESSQISSSPVGISITGSNVATVQNNTLRSNGVGISLTGAVSGVDIRQNTISLSSLSGIEFGAFSYSGLAVLYNTLSAGNFGFYMSGNASTAITNNSVSYNKVGFYYANGPSHVAHFNDIYGNELGMDVANMTVDASYNYWGDKTGPYHSLLNPEGKGNPVGGDGANLDFIFYLTNPVGQVNLRPTANIRSDVRTVRPGQDVTFFATSSSDDGQVDQYLFDFGDGRNSGWTTLSVFVYKYSAVGTYYASVIVMDDFGVQSINTANTRMDVQNLASSLTVSVTPSELVVGSGKQVSVSVRSTSAGLPVQDTNISLFSIIGGSFVPISGFTDSSGYFVTMFTAPVAAAKTSVRITASGSKAGYADGSGHESLEVLPILTVEVEMGVNAAKSEASLNVSVRVTHDSNSVANATVTLSSDGGGDFLPETGLTNASGFASFVFAAPSVTSSINITITAAASMAGYFEGRDQTVVTVNPRVLVVEVLVQPGRVDSGGAATVFIHVSEDGQPVEGADLTLSSSLEGAFSGANVTDANGDAQISFVSPGTTSEANVTLAVSASKAGYVDAPVAQASLMVNPLPGAGPWSFLGLSLTTWLLILIPVIAVIVVAVLIKLKIIVISRGEQEAE